MRSRATRLGLMSLSLGGLLVLAACDTADYHVRFAVGENGVIVATTNAGSTWAKQTSGVKETLFAVSFAGPKNGCAVGEDGSAIATTDGSTWNAASSVPTVKDLRGLDLVSRTSSEAAQTNQVSVRNYDAFAVGDNGTIIHSTDQCSTWSSQVSGTTKNLSAVLDCRCTNSEAWAVGDGGTILHTSNGGTAWSPQTSATKADLKAIFVWGNTQGWIAGSGGVILHTTNGGTTWTKQKSNTAHNLEGIAFGDATHGYAVGDDGVIVATSDGGTTWTKQASHTTTDLDSVATTLNGAPAWFSTGDYHDAIAVGGNGVVLMTTDAGVTWTKVNAGTKVGLEGTA
jgi:photosystem II stability/assembly factor-like uncharacterized protein